MSQIIEVFLSTCGEEDVLIFSLDKDHPDEYMIDLNSDSNQAQLKKVFSKLLEFLFEDDVELKYSVMEGYSKGLYKDVCEEYINDLNGELVSVKKYLKDQMDSLPK